MRVRHWTIVFAVIALGGGLLWMMLGREPIEDGRCRLTRKKADPSSQLTGLTYQFVQPLDGKPDGVQDVPAGFGQPRYYRIMSGDKPILMVADFTEKNVRLCADTDGDGILSEERCFKAKLSKETPVSGRRQQLGPISLVSGDGAARANDGFYVICYREDARDMLIPFAAFFRTGRLRLDGRTYRVAVVDGDYDGSYHSILSLPLDRPWRLPACDVFAIDLNRNGKFEVSMYDRSEVRPLGRLVKVADDYYALDIAPDGMSLTLSKTEPQFGTLAVESNDTTAELRLWSDAADQHLPEGRRWQLPVGKYKGIYAILRKTDASGDVWTFGSSSSSAFTRLGPLEFFTIKPGETTSTRLGPPFVVKADVQKGPSGTVSISLVLVGCRGEEYQAGFRRNNRRAPEREFKIVDEQGNVLVADKFKYG